MSSPIINVTGNMTVNVMAPIATAELKAATAELKPPSIPLTPFTKATVLDVRNELLLFNTYVERELKDLDGVLIPEMVDLVKGSLDHLLTVARGDYSPELLTEYGSKVAAVVAAIVFHFGGELSIL